jgi:hypothetical protein
MNYSFFPYSKSTKTWQPLLTTLRIVLSALLQSMISGQKGRRIAPCSSGIRCGDYIRPALKKAHFCRRRSITHHLLTAPIHHCRPLAPPSACPHIICASTATQKLTIPQWCCARSRLLNQLWNRLLPHLCLPLPAQRRCLDWMKGGIEGMLPSWGRQKTHDTR